MESTIVSPSSVDPNGFEVRSEDDFEIITMYGRPPGQSNPVPSNMLPYPVNPVANVSYQSSNGLPYQNNSIANASSVSRTREAGHPLDGIPFKLAPALELSSAVAQDPIFDDVKKTLERVKNLLNSKDFTYDCTLERNFLRENGSK